MPNKSSQIVFGLDLFCTTDFLETQREMNCLKINDRETIEYLSGQGLLKKFSAPSKYFCLFLAYIYLFV
jgi:hypothetical protein